MSNICSLGKLIKELLINFDYVQLNIVQFKQQISECTWYHELLHKFRILKNPKIC